MKRFLRYFTGILPFFAAEVIQNIIYMAFYTIYSFIIGIQIGLKNDTEGATVAEAIITAMLPEVLYLFSVLAIIGCGVVFFFWYRQEIRGEVRGSLQDLLTPKTLTLFVLLGLGGQFFFTGVMSLIEPIFTKLFTDYAQTLEGIMGGNDIVVLLLVIFIAPIAEELVFRGMILHKTSKVISFWGANLLQALLFGVYHWNIVQGVYATLMGFVLGMVYHKYRTIFAPILLHMIINASSLLVILLPSATISNAIIAAVGATLISIVLLKLRPFAWVVSQEEETIT